MILAEWFDRKKERQNKMGINKNSGDQTTFGFAFEMLKAGSRIWRKCWEDKGVYVWLLPASKIKKEWVKDYNLKDCFEDRDELECDAAIRMFTEDKKVITGWMPTLQDMMADDWISELPEA